MQGLRRHVLRRLLAPVVFCCCAAAVAIAQERVTVVRVIDGDTVVAKAADGATFKVRLIGVDTPETVHPHKLVERFGREASNYLRCLAEGETASLEFEASGRYDRYGRTLAYLYIEETLINKKIISDGYGHAYVAYPFSKMPEFLDAEDEAREGDRGLWGPELSSVAAGSPLPCPPEATLKRWKP